MFELRQTGQFDCAAASLTVIRLFELKRMAGARNAETMSERNESNGGAEGIRTPDPLLAKQVLYQLSYSPTMKRDIIILIQPSILF